MILNLKLRDLVIDTAKKNDIHLHKAGVPSVVISVPTRHINSHNTIFNRKDYDSTVKLLKELVRELDAKTVADLVAW